VNCELLDGELERDVDEMNYELNTNTTIPISALTMNFNMLKVISVLVVRTSSSSSMISLELGGGVVCIYLKAVLRDWEHRENSTCV
jgi:hypothetical protein